MPLILVECEHCRHQGIIAATLLPTKLTCTACKRVSMVKKAKAQIAATGERNRANVERTLHSAPLSDHDQNPSESSELKTKVACVTPLA
jgi:hypothetical protein